MGKDRRMGYGRRSRSKGITTKYNNIESITLQIAKQSKDFQKELKEVRKEHPLVYLEYIAQEVMIAELSILSLIPRLDGSTAMKIQRHLATCKRDFERAIGSATNDEEAASAFEGYSGCLHNVLGH